MAYKLSYYVINDKVEVVANDEIALACEILNMERDVGFLCHGISITKIEREGNTNKLQDLEKIKRYADILYKHHKQLSKKK